MNTADLSGPLLASVSRSFYLTIRMLPAVIRGPIGLAYLLARASDTIADSPDAPVAARLRHLSDFGDAIQRGGVSNLNELQKEIHSSHPGEVELLHQLGRCLDWLERLPAPEQSEIRTVMARIIRGQATDLEQFSQPGSVTALPTPEALDEYTFLVAGCVGEFWTRLCLTRIPGYSQLELDPLCRLGINFGKGLQLVNILRDAPADLRNGRCYLPATDLASAGLRPEDLLQKPVAARPIFEVWQTRAETLLWDGYHYIAALKSFRLRAACFLPWRLGMLTIDLLRQRPPLEHASRVKLPRSVVRSSLLLAIPAALSPGAHSFLARRLREGA